MNTTVPLPDNLHAFVADQKWTFAKTYAATWPHEYIVRDQVDEGLLELALRIREAEAVRSLASDNFRPRPRKCPCQNAIVGA